MKDKNENTEEYQFPDADPTASASEHESTYEPHPVSPAPDLKRVGIVLIGLVLVIFLGYKFTEAMMGSKKKIMTKPVVVMPTPKITTVAMEPQLSVIPSPSQGSVKENEVTKKIAAFELSQDTLRQEMSSLNTQVTGMEGEVTDLSSKLNQLTQSINDLQTKIDNEMMALAPLLEKAHAATHDHKKHKSRHKMVYYIQALIPGRAWIVSEKGTTLTIREGSMLDGYGTIKLIDATEGKIMTSSGRVIRFNQDDS